MNHEFKIKFDVHLSCPSQYYCFGHVNTLLVIEAVHTTAAKPGIFAVDTAMHTNSIVETVYKSCFTAVAD